jgi:hypothetical protein
LIERGPVLLKKDDSETIYSGQWKGDQRHGRGMEVDRLEGSFYIGEWKEDEKDGYGRLVFESGNVYDGEWIESVAHGKGKISIQKMFQFSNFFRNIP